MILTLSSTLSATLSGSPTDVKERTLGGFGIRLRAPRQVQGLTQDELGAAVGISNRMIAYYERDGAQPPGAILVELAKALRCSTDELLGVKPVRETLSPKTARLLKRLPRRGAPARRPARRPQAR